MWGNSRNTIQPTHRTRGERLRCARPAGFTLIELLATITVMAIVLTAVIPYFRSSEADQILAAAQIVASDLSEARNLAVTNNSDYRITFDATHNLYYLQHAGANTALNTLPPTPYGLASDSATQRTTNLGLLPVAGVHLHTVIARGTTSSTVTSVTFSTLGNTTRTQITEVWLKTGITGDLRYLPITINPVTGLTEIGDLTGHPPTLAAAAAASS